MRQNQTDDTYEKRQIFYSTESTDRSAASSIDSIQSQNLNVSEFCETSQKNQLYWITCSKFQKDQLPHFISLLENHIHYTIQYKKTQISDSLSEISDCESNDDDMKFFISPGACSSINPRFINYCLQTSEILSPHLSHSKICINLNQNEQEEFQRYFIHNRILRPFLRTQNIANNHYILSFYGISEYKYRCNNTHKKQKYFEFIKDEIIKILDNNHTQRRKKIAFFTHYPPIIDDEYDYRIINKNDLDQFTSKQLGIVIGQVLALYPHNEIIVYSSSINSATRSSFYISSAVSPLGYSISSAVSASKRQGLVTVYTLNQTLDPDEDKYYLNTPFLQVCTETMHPYEFKIETKNGIETYVKGTKQS